MKIDQRVAINKDFGICLRSSGIFYFFRNRNANVVFNILDHWKIKRGLDVTLLASLRRMDGSLVRRDSIIFDGKAVVNYTPDTGGEDFEGSVEFEAFSNANMVIPVAGIMASYQTRHGVSTVHTYSRIYSQHEVEEQRNISEGMDSCWSIRPVPGERNIGVFHNGHQEQPAQTLSLTLSNKDGKKIHKTKDIVALRPFETTKLDIDGLFPEMPDFLDGGYGNIAVDYLGSTCFPRMLIGRHREDWSDAQFTHTNFNYAKHETNLVDNTREGYMYIPPLQVSEFAETVIYPDFHPGSYRVDNAVGSSQSFETGQIVTLSNDNDVATRTIFERCDEEGDGFPARLVTGFRLSDSADRIPAECSLNIIHRDYFQKYTTWGLVYCDDQLQSDVYFTECETVFGTANEGMSIELLLYSAMDGEAERLMLDRGHIDLLKAGCSLERLFPNAREKLNGEGGYLYLKTDYPGFINYTMVRNHHGSVTIEHWF